MSVGGWPTSNVGRSCQAGPKTQPPFDQARPAIGHYFRMQYSWALNRTCVDDSFLCSDVEDEAQVPQVIFTTGWNEFIAQRFIQGTGGCTGFIGEPCQPGDSFFVDEYIQEYSRDIEPMQGGHQDNYYLQLTAFSRYYKGAVTPPVGKGYHPVTVDCQFDEWGAVTPVYQDDLNDAPTRNYTGYGNTSLHYSDDSPIDDLCDAKVALTATSLYFYLSSCTGGWKRGGNGTLLYLGTPHSSTGWYGYDFIVRVEDATLYRHMGAWDARTFDVVGTVDLCVGKVGELEVEVKLDSLGWVAGKGVDFIWKWWNGEVAGGMGVTDPADFMRYGDAAPNARFSYVYSNEGEESHAAEAPVVEE